MLNAFRVLSGHEKTMSRDRNSIEAFKDKFYGAATSPQETTLFITEDDLMRNINKVFLDAPPFFGKMLYIWMSEGYDRVKISLLKFLECLHPLQDADFRLNWNKIAF